MMEYILIFTFVVLALLPFLPGLLELLLKRDIDPLYIKQDYSKDPAFFGRSFQKIIMETSKKGLKKISENTAEIVLSKGKPEKMVLFKNKVGGKLSDLVFAEGSEVETDKPLETPKEVIIKGDFYIQHTCIMRSLFVLGDLAVDRPLITKRWIHVEGEANIRAPSDLGINFYARRIQILVSCTFKRMFAEVIKIGEEPKEEDFKGNVSYIKGTIKSKGSLNIRTQDKKLVIDGDLISDKDIVVEGGVWIKGSIFTHSEAVLLKGVIVGEEGKVKSVVAKKMLILAEGVKVYGYLHTDGEGKVEI